MIHHRYRYCNQLPQCNTYGCAHLRLLLRTQRRDGRRVAAAHGRLSNQSIECNHNLVVSLADLIVLVIGVVVVLIVVVVVVVEGVKVVVVMSTGMM